jgi:uncharacterized protein DUF6982/PilZ domain-containing protein
MKRMAILDRAAARVISASAASAALPRTISRQVTASPSGRDRRRHPRLLLNELVWLESARLREGPPVTIVDLSAGGALLELPERLRPGSIQSLEISGPATEIVVLVDVLRCRPIDASESMFRVACRFPRPIDFPETPQRIATLDNGDHLAPELLPPSVDPLATVETPAPTASSAACDAPKGDTAWQKLVVRFSDGSTSKGFSQDFNPERRQFSLWPSLTAARHEGLQVMLDQLKAVFFVRDFVGDPTYVEQKTYGPSSQGRRIEVTFNDGEVLLGSTLVYKPNAIGFFVTPGDPKTNNTRVFVAAASVRCVRFP